MDTDTRRTVLIVGQGKPTVGGIPSFIEQLLADPLLQQQVDLRYLNTTPKGTKRPAAFTLGNIYFVLHDSWRVFRFGRGADVVHLHLAPAPTLPLLRCIVLCAAARIARARVILHAHTNRIQIFMEQGSYRTLLRAVLWITDVFIAVSAETASALAAISPKARHITNGVVLERFATGPKASRPLVAFIGTVCERKGLSDLKSALERIRLDRPEIYDEIDVLIAGDATQEGPGVFERITQQYSQAGLNRVRFLGPLDQTGIIDLLAKSWIFCLPSHDEASPLSILEAMAAEAVVIATSVGDIPLMLGNGQAGMLIEPGNHEALADALCALVENDEHRQRFAAAGRARVEEYYDYATMRLEILELYLRIP